MDLLASSYISDDEMEKHSIQKITIKWNDDQSSSEESVEIIFDSIKNKKLAEKNIEFICLDDSDDDDREVPYSTLPSKDNICSSKIKKEVSDEMDYLNLDSSDTDEEQQQIQNRVNCLLSSAAILDDIECEPTETLPAFNTSPSFTDGTPLWIKRSNSPALAVKQTHHNTICYQESLFYKKVKLENPSTDNTVVNVNAAKRLDPRTRMYRKDGRIVAACKENSVSCIPSTLSRTISAHEKAISSLSWCAFPYGHLFLSSSLDCTVKIWDIYSQSKPIQTLNFDLGVRAAKWSSDKEQIIAGGFGKEVHIIDALSGQEHVKYDIYDFVSCIAIHPSMEDVILCGTSNAIFGFDLRVNCKLPVRSFLKKFGEVLDMVFLNQNEFVCSTNMVSRDSANRTIMVWDFNSGAIMSNQIFLERYTCPSLKVSPIDLSFIAQTNGNYIAKFSSIRPFKIEKKAYIGHKISGFGIECDISPDGHCVASGDAKGDVYFYNYANTRLVKKLTVKSNVATNKLQWHPTLPHVMAVATWDGQIHVWN